MPKVLQTKVKITETHDRLSVKADYPTGGSVLFSILRDGERLTVGGSNDAAIASVQSTTIDQWCRPRDGELNGDRIKRIGAMLQTATGVADLCKKLK